MSKKQRSSQRQRLHSYDTSHRCKVKKAIEYFEKKEFRMIKTLKYDIFDTLNTSHTFEYEILTNSDRTIHNDLNTSDLRDRKYKITRAQIVRESNKSNNNKCDVISC